MGGEAVAHAGSHDVCRRFSNSDGIFTYALIHRDTVATWPGSSPLPVLLLMKQPSRAAVCTSPAYARQHDHDFSNPDTASISQQASQPPDVPVRSTYACTNWTPYASKPVRIMLSMRAACTHCFVVVSRNTGSCARTTQAQPQRQPPSGIRSYKHPMTIVSGAADLH